MIAKSRLLTRCFRCFQSKHQTKLYSSSSTVSDSQDEQNKSVDIEDKIVEELLVNIARKKVRIDPDKTSMLLFPGQGSQYVGMAKNLLQYPNVKEMFDVASEILGYNLLELCLRGPKTELDKTIYCQPAVVVTSLAGIEKLQSESPEVLENCFATAGYSVGEYAALVFSGALSFEDAIELIKVRANEMQKASDDSSSGMISVIGSARTKFNMACAEAVEYCKETLDMEHVICKVSGYLAPNVRTIAGHRAALDFLISQKGKNLMRRIQILPVSGGFHSPLMRPAVKKLKSAIASVEVKSPIINVYANIDGKVYHNANDIKNKLPDQIIKPVHWEQTMHSILSRSIHTNMPHTYELGPGRQLGSLLNKCNGKAWKKYMPVDIINTNEEKSD